MMYSSNATSNSFDLVELYLLQFVFKFVYLIREVKKISTNLNHLRMMTGTLRIAVTCLFFIVFIHVNAQVTFVIESLPSATPKEDTIFITGSFNNWQVNDAGYMLHPQLDGRYSITLPCDSSQIEFKFTRGSWLKVETSEINDYIENRVVKCKGQQTYNARIENWQDLGGVKEFNYIVLLLFAIGFYGVSILFFAIRIHYKIRFFKPFFFLFNIALIVLLIGVVFYNQANFIWQSRIGMAGLVFLFLWGPLFRFFILSLKGQKEINVSMFHFLPAVIVVLLGILRFTNFKPLDFYAEELNAELIVGNFLLICLGVFSSIGYHFVLIKKMKQLHENKSENPKKYRLVGILYLISASSLFYLLVTSVLLFFDFKVGVNNGIELMLVLLSIIIFVEFYYYLRYPVLFYKSTGGAVTEKYNGKAPIYSGNRASAKQALQKSSPQKLPEELTSQLKEMLKKQMLVEKVFKEPKLNIATLSEIIDTKPHILSRILNEQFNKNFRDYINEYRIKEFIELAGSEKYKHYTLLALSYEVGFNSKSTFNLAFKKVTGLSPRNFLKENEISIRD